MTGGRTWEEDRRMLYISVPGRTGWEEERKEDLKGGTERRTGGRLYSGVQENGWTRTMRGVQEDGKDQDDERSKDDERAKDDGRPKDDERAKDDERGKRGGSQKIRSTGDLKWTLSGFFRLECGFSAQRLGNRT